MENSAQQQIEKIELLEKLLQEKSAATEKFQREVQIELALERVRARTMAMQKSEELAEAAKLLFQQVQALGLPVLSCGYNIWQSGETVCTGWMSDSSGSISPPFRIPLTESPTFIRFRESKKKGEHFYAEEVSGEALTAQYRYLLSLPNFKSIAEGFQKAGFALPAYQVNNVVNFSHGNLIFITDQPAPAAWDIFKRFGKVFEQTYTRFLDLQKAEAQAREAQIELGLERVRARAMAMQGSAELSNLIETVYAELTRLDISLNRCVIMIFDSETLGATWWMADEAGAFTQKGLYLQYHEHPPHLAYLKAWQERREKWQYILEGKEKKDWDEYIFSETELRQLPDFIVANMKAVEKAYISASFNNFGCLTIGSLQPITEESSDILLRFSKVFDSTYTRFNDLKKASRMRMNDASSVRDALNGGCKTPSLLIHSVTPCLSSSKMQ